MRIKSVGFVLSLILAAAVFALAAWLSVHVSEANKDAALAMEAEAMEEIVSATARSLDGYLQHNVTRMRALAESEAVVRSLAGLGEHLAQQRLELLMADLKGYWMLFSYDKSGNINAGVTATGLDLRGQQVSDRDYYKAIVLSRENLFISEVFQPKTGEMTGFSLAVPVYDSRGALLGGVAAVLDRQALTEEFLSPIRLGETGFAFIWDERLRIIAHPDPAAVFKDMSNEDYARRARLEQEGQLTYEVGRRIKYLAFDTLSLTGWIVGLSVFEDEMIGPMAEQGRQGVLMGLAGAGVLALFTFFLCWFLVSLPLKNLIRYTQELGAGNLTAEPKGLSPLDFNQLVQALRDLVEEMRRRASYSHGVLNALPAPCIVTNREAKVAFVNKEFLDLLRKPGEPERYLGMACRELVKDDPRAGELLVKAISEHRPVRQMLELGPLGGDVDRRGMVLSAKVNPFYNEENVLQGTVVQWADETDLHEQRRKSGELEEELKTRMAKTQELVRIFKRLEAERKARDSERHRLERQVREMSLRLDENSRELSLLRKEKEHLQERLRDLRLEGGDSLKEMAQAEAELSRTAQRVYELAEQRAEDVKALRDAAGELGNSGRMALAAAEQAVHEGRHAREVVARGRLASQDTVNAMDKLQLQAASLLRTMSDLYAQSERVQQAQNNLDNLTEMLNMVSVNASIKALRQASLSADKLSALADELRQISSRAKSLLGGGEEMAGALRQSAESAIQAAGAMVETLEKTMRLSQAAAAPARETHKIMEAMDRNLQAMAESLEPQREIMGSLEQRIEKLLGGDPTLADSLQQISAKVGYVSQKLDGSFRRVFSG